MGKKNSNLKPLPRKKMNIIRLNYTIYQTHDKKNSKVLFGKLLQDRKLNE